MLALAVVGVVLQLVSVNSSEIQANGHSIQGDISRDGALRGLPLARHEPSHPDARDRAATRLPARSPPRHDAHGQPHLERRDEQPRRLAARDLANGRFVAWCSISTKLARPDQHSGVPWTGPGWGPANGRVRA